jgi:hypothetical protein
MRAQGENGDLVVIVSGGMSLYIDVYAKTRDLRLFRLVGHLCFGIDNKTCQEMRCALVGHAP